MTPSATSSDAKSGYVFIAHDTKVQELMDEGGLSWGAQYEIARGVCNGWWTWQNVEQRHERFSALPSCNQQSAPLVAEIMGRPEFAAHNFALW